MDRFRQGDGISVNIVKAPSIILQLRWGALWCAIASVALGVRTAHASEDSFGAGNGHAGALVVSTPSTALNHATTLTAGTNAGDAELFVAAPAAFSVGDLIMV